MQPGSSVHILTLHIAPATAAPLLPSELCPGNEGARMNPFLREPRCKRVCRVHALVKCVLKVALVGDEKGDWPKFGIAKKFNILAVPA